MKIYIIGLLLVLCSCRKHQIGDKPAHTLCETPDEIRVCPSKIGNIFLPRSYPARAIYVGYSSDQIHLDFLDLLIASVRELKIQPMVNILIPRLEDVFAYKKLKKYFSKYEYKFINFIPTSSDETIWAQDYYEILFDTQTGFSKIIDLPYLDREGENLPTSIALSCQKELIAQGVFDKGRLPGNGDYGGNIEPITTEVLVVGNNISSETSSILHKLTTQKIVTIDVEWLETGHVDELVTTLPFKKNALPCEQTLLVASPELAIDIIDSSPPMNNEVKSGLKPYDDGTNTWPDREYCLHSKNGTKKECVSLRNANRIYQDMINKNIESLQNTIKSIHGCKLRIERFPQLFVPINELKVYGTIIDRAVPLNPNSVNNIFFFPNLILPRQKYGPFQTAVESVVKKFPYKVIYIDGKFVHELNGGIHCATNVAYGCTPQ